MSEDTRITANPQPQDTRITADLPSETDTRICMKDGRCPKCGSADVIPNVSVLEHVGANTSTENVKAVVARNPDAWVFKGEARTSLKAWVCGSCGFTELYAKNPAALLAAYRQRELQS